MRSIAIADTSALVAAVDRSERFHAATTAVLRRGNLGIVVPALVIAEASYLIGRRLGARAEAAFVQGITSLPVEAPLPDEWPLIADLVERYADLDIGTTDASIAVLADRLGTDLVISLDRRHFGVIRSPAGRPFRVLPELHRAINEEPATYHGGRLARGVDLDDNAALLDLMDGDGR